MCEAPPSGQVQVKTNSCVAQQAHRSTSCRKLPAAPHAAGSVPLSWLPTMFRPPSCGSAPGWAQLSGRVPDKLFCRRSLRAHHGVYVGPTWTLFGMRLVIGFAAICTASCGRHGSSRYD